MKRLLLIILCILIACSLASCGKKKQGPQGEPGKDGITPTIEISDDGYWVINGEKTEVKATTESDVSTSDENPYGLEFEMIDYSYVVSMCETTSENIVIPETYKGRAVVAINASAFRGLVNIKSVTIPDTVTSIGSSAFKGCTSLTGVTIPDSVASIGYEVFYNCANLTSVTIGNGVTSIGERAFYGCSSLASVTIPDSVTSISSSAFSGCSSLTRIDVDPDNAYYKSIDGNLYNKDGKTLIRYAPGKTDTTFSIPDGVTYMGVSAFEDCTSLTSVTIPDSVTSIRNSAFYGCSSLASVTIPDSVTYIDNAAFSDCSNLTTINYCGTEAQWNAIDKGYNWDSGTGNYTIVFNYNG